MKVAIVSMVNIKHMTLISLYTKYFEEEDIDFDIIYVDKYGFPEEFPGAKNINRTFIDIKESDHKLRKLRKYFSFRKVVRNEINNNNYDLIIVWRSETAMLLWDILLKSKNEFIYNIRDYCFENNKIIYYLQNRLIKKSKLTTVSSPKFLEFLPKNNKIEFVNSVNYTLLNQMIEMKKEFKKKDFPLSIGFIGNVRFIENDKKLLLALKNDDRFIIQYFGVGSNELEVFAKKNNINNVEFIDSFESEETLELLEKIDIINNLYGNNSAALDTAISIKYYYAVFLRKPILVWKDTFMEEITRNNNSSFVFDGDFNYIKEKILKWYESIEENDINEYLKATELEILKENKKLEDFLKSLVEEGE
ncbi:hypothetical protein [Vagococcus fluvialis]|uniref:hypothetical protein n=1 Tax=Vagococcus fluvialis TaxID=2738 RepID=UPI003B5AAFA5